MGARVDEVEAVGHAGPHTTLPLYSNGEISHMHTMDCKLHNQTMTITLRELRALTEHDPCQAASASVAAALGQPRLTLAVCLKSLVRWPATLTPR